MSQTNYTNLTDLKDVDAGSSCHRLEYDD